MDAKKNTKIPKYHLLVKWIGGAAVAHSTMSMAMSAMAICYNLSYSEALVRAGLPRLDTRRRELTRTWGERVAKQPGQTFFTLNTVVTRGAKRFLEPFC